MDTCCPLRAPFSLSRNASLLVIFARIFFAEIDTEIQRDEEIVDGDGKDIGARDGVGTAELESGFGRITTSNPSPGRERLMGESRSAALKAVEETRTEKLLLIWIQSFDFYQRSDRGFTIDLFLLLKVCIFVMIP